MWRIHYVVGRKERKDLVGNLDGVSVIFSNEMDVAADTGVGHRTANFVHGAFLAGDRLDHVRSADKHLRTAPDHDDEIHERR